MSRIPLIGPRARYRVLSAQASWVTHEMAGGSALSGEAPETASVSAENLDPTVTAGKAVWSDLTKGGLFTLLGNHKRPLVVEAALVPGTATVKIINPQTSTERDMPGSTPFKVAPGEYLKVSGGNNGDSVSFLVREDIPAR